MVIVRVDQIAINFHATCFLVPEVLGRVEDGRGGAALGAREPGGDKAGIAGDNQFKS